jgi:hypothetical protein
MLAEAIAFSRTRSGKHLQPDRGAPLRLVNFQKPLDSEFDLDPPAAAERLDPDG